MLRRNGQVLASQRVGWLGKNRHRKVLHANELRGINRAEFEQIARDLDLPPPELYRLLTGCRVSPDALEERLAAEFEAFRSLRSGCVRSNGSIARPECGCRCRSRHAADV